MEISAEKTKLMTNNTSGINSEIKVDGQKLETVTSLKHLGSVIADKSSEPEILSRIAQTTAALTRLKPLWNDMSIHLSSKIRLTCALLIIIIRRRRRTHIYNALNDALYACESWTLIAELRRRIQTMEMRCYRKILCISYKDSVTNEEVRAKIQQAIGSREDLLTTVKRLKLQWYGRVSRSSDLAKTILQGPVKGGRRQGGQKKRWDDNIREWIGLEFAKSQGGQKKRWDDNIREWTGLEFAKSQGGQKKRWDDNIREWTGLEFAKSQRPKTTYAHLRGVHSASNTSLQLVPSVFVWICLGTWKTKENFGSSYWRGTVWCCVLHGVWHCRVEVIVP